MIDAMTERIEQNIPGWYGSSASLQVRDPEIRCFTNSFFLRYPLATSRGAKAILVKIRRHPKMHSLTRAIRSRELHRNSSDEYETLQHVYSRIGSEHPHFTALRPLDYFEDFFAIVMEEFPARSLRQLLKEQRASVKVNDSSPAIPVIAEMAGELLRCFHEQVYSTTQSAYSSGDILAEAKPYALQLQGCSRGRIDAQAILDALAHKLARKGIQSIPYTHVHQDLSCDNVLVSKEGKVCLADIKVEPSPIYSDLGLLLIHPETFRDQIFRHGKYFSQQVLQSYRESLLKGYFGESLTDDFLVNIYAAIRVLEKWAMHEQLFHNYKGWKRVITRPLSPMVTSYFEKLWNRYLQR